MKRLAIIGSTDLAQLIAHHAFEAEAFEVVGFFDDFKTAGEITPRGPILGSIQDIGDIYGEGRFDCCIVGIGYNHLDFRNECYAKLSRSVPIATLVHPSCYIDKSARIGQGSFLLPGCTVDAASVIGENTVLNAGCTIAHDTQVGDNCFFGPSVTLAGFVKVASSCFLGVGTTVIDNIEICRGTQTGGGAVITQNVKISGLYVGIPARRIRE